MTTKPDEKDIERALRYADTAPGPDGLASAVLAAAYRAQSAELAEANKMHLHFESLFLMEQDKVLAVEAEVSRLRKALEKYCEDDCCEKVNERSERIRMTWPEIKAMECGKCDYCLAQEALASTQQAEGQEK